MLWTPASSPNTLTDNWGTNPSTTPGTSVIPGASNAEGSWTQLLTALAFEVHGILIRVSDGTQSGQIKNHLLDLGIDPAGGSSYTAVISNIVCGESALITNTGSGHRYFFPLRIPSGATVAARIQGSNATAGTVIVGIRVWGEPDAPYFLPVGQYSETVGTITNSNGVSFTPGNASDGTWVSLGTTSRECWWWQIGYQVDNGTITGEYSYIEIGVGDSTNKSVITRVLHGGATTESCGDCMGAHLVPLGAYCSVPAGSELWIRGRCNNAADTGYNGVAIGVGG
jgi:hypothetical protein